MPRFFIDSEPTDFITVTGSDARHIGYSLRMKNGDSIIFCRMGTDYFCTITEMTESSVTCRIDRSEPSKCEPNISLTLYQAFPKQDKFEQIIQKTVELGIVRIVPFISNRCVSRPNKADFAKKLERFQRISEEAAKQSGRGIIPEIAPILSLEEAIEDMNGCSLKLICYENGGEKLSSLNLEKHKSIGIMIGSEGGFERSEVEKAVSSGAVPIWLGERILRCETCPVAMTAVIMNLTDNM
ncbi:MAG: 16S rRNA (uracil(1498)-N(3))-methyltransferase [Oscillospiraceae bacterium]|nr:16S rRNA (uracil(1498)-N(3))-methyltransferase [Oscillospiraceae bacterium]